MFIAVRMQSNYCPSGIEIWFLQVTLPGFKHGHAGLNSYIWVMFFDDYIQHQDACLNPSLLWEYDISAFDFLQMRDVVVQRVIERGWKNDWYFMLNFYGIEGVAAAVKNIAYFNEKDMNFASLIFDIPLSEMKCYIRKQSRLQHWNS